MNVPKDISIQNLLTGFAPDMARQSIADAGSAAQLAGTEFSLVMDISGDLYHYVVKNGTEFLVGKGDLAAPMVRVKVSREELEKMIQTQNLDMLLGIMKDLTRAKYDALQRVRGQMIAELSNDDGSVFRIYAILNGAETPKAAFKLSAANSSALIRKEANPVNLFMSGQLRIEGDMAFAMSAQPLFS